MASSSYLDGINFNWGTDPGLAYKTAYPEVDIFNKAKLQKDIKSALPDGSSSNDGSNWFGEGGYLATGANVAKGLAGLMSAYTGWEQLGLAKDQFGFEKAATNRNIATQGKIANNAYQNAGDVGLALAGSALSPEQRAVEQEKIKQKYVDVSAIG